MRKSSYETDIKVAYIHGRIEAQIEAFADSAGIPAPELASRVGSLLCGAASGEVLGTEHRVPALPGQTAKGSKAVAKVALDGGTHRKPQKSRKVKKTTEWWWKLSEAERNKIKAKRLASYKKVMAARKES